MRRWTVTILASVVLLVGGGGLAFLSQLQPFGNPSQRQIIEIPAGFSFTDVARLLHQRHLIKSDWAFTWMGRLLGADRNIIPGEYEFQGGMAPNDVLHKITKGEVLQYAVTIPEGYSIEQIAGVLQEKGLVEQDVFVQLTRNSQFLAQLGFQLHDLEGYLFPDTYHFTRHMKPEAIIQTMVARFKQSWTPQLQERASELGMSLHQTMTLASVIEKETGLSQERGLISGVFHNRLRKKIPLQSDPTVMATCVKRIWMWTVRTIPIVCEDFLRGRLPIRVKLRFVPHCFLFPPTICTLCPAMMGAINFPPPWPNIIGL